MARPDRRRQIMQAAEKLFTTRQFHEITTDEVARAAKVGKGTLYRYFRDKEDLFFQTATSGFDELCDLVQARTAEGGSFSEQLLGACTQIRGFFDSRRQLIRMMHTEDGRVLLATGTIHERWLAHRKKLRAAVGDIIRRGVSEGQVRDDIPADILAAFLLGLMRMQTMDLKDVPEKLSRPQVVVDFFLRGASSRNPASRGRKPAGTVRVDTRDLTVAARFSKG